MRDHASTWLLAGALAGLAAAAVVLARRRRSAQGIDPRRDRWHGEGPQAVDERGAS